MGGRIDRNTDRRKRRSLLHLRAVKAREEQRMLDLRENHPGYRARPRDRRVIDDLSIGSGKRLAERAQQREQHRTGRRAWPVVIGNDLRAGFIGRMPAASACAADDPASTLRPEPGPTPRATPPPAGAFRSPSDAREGEPKETARAA